MGPRSFGPAAIMLALAAAVLFAAPATSAQQPRESRARILVGFDPGVSVAAQRSLPRARGCDRQRAPSPDSRLRRLRAGRPTGARPWRSFAGTRASVTPSPIAVQTAAQVPNDPALRRALGPEQHRPDRQGRSRAQPDADIDAPEAWDVDDRQHVGRRGGHRHRRRLHHPDLAANIVDQPRRDRPGNDGIDDDGNGYVDDCPRLGLRQQRQRPDGRQRPRHARRRHHRRGREQRRRASPASTGTSRSWPLKFLDANGAGTIADAVAALYYATMMGAGVIATTPGAAAVLAGARRRDRRRPTPAGSLFVAAAGNNAANNDAAPVYPADYDAPNVISVAATDHDDALASFSNYGRRDGGPRRAGPQSSRPSRAAATLYAAPRWRRPTCPAPRRSRRRRSRRDRRRAEGAAAPYRRPDRRSGGARRRGRLNGVARSRVWGLRRPGSSRRGRASPSRERHGPVTVLAPTAAIRPA